MAATLAVLVILALAIGGLSIAAARTGGSVPASRRPGISPVPLTGTGIAPTTDRATPGRTAHDPGERTGRGRGGPVRLHVVAGHRLARVRPLVVIAPTTFRVASFNLLGASHTGGRGDRAGYASGPRRLVGELRLLLDKQVSVAGLQEFQPPQVDAFRRLTGAAWGIYPGSAVDNSIVWRTAEWTFVEGHTEPFPYFHGRQVPDPVVLLRNTASGRAVWFVNIHSPADVHGMHNAGLRAATVTRAAGLVDELASDGTPVVLTGDMNDRVPFACTFTRLSGMHSSDGWRTDGGGCHAGVGYPNVDWIMGSDAVGFADGAPDFVSEHQHLSDHPIITATATVAGSRTRR